MTATETDVGAAGLRERKKVQTRAAIVEAARDLFDAQGFAATTIPQIAARADVSPRTVSYYFPVKEELVFPDRDEVLVALSDALENRLEGETASDALARWLTTMIADKSTTQKARDHGRRELIAGDPGLRAYELEIQSRGEEVIAASFAADLFLPVDHHVPRMIAAATLAALESLGDEAEEHPEPSVAEDLIEDVMTFIRAGARELAAD